MKVYEIIMENISRLRINDVYDFATDIASEFQKLADLCSVDAMQNLILKVINVLEHLETYVTKQEILESKIVSLNDQNCDLLIRRSASEEDKLKFEQDIEEVERSWLKEISELKITVLQLQEDNKNLQKVLDNQRSTEPDSCNSSEVPHSLYNDFSKIIFNLNNQLAEKEKLLKEYDTHSKMLQATVEELQDKNEALQEQLCDVYEKPSVKSEDSKSQNQNLFEYSGLDEGIENCSATSSDTLGKIKILEGCAKSEVLCDKLPLQYSTEKVTGSDEEALFSDILLARIADMEQKLQEARQEAEMYKQRSSALLGTKSPSSHSYGIRQLFRFVLGVVPLYSSSFRCY